MVLGVFSACHHTHVVHQEEVERPPTRDTTRVVREAADPVIAALFKDTARSNAFATEGRTYNVRNAAERRELQAVLSRERALWQAAKLVSYRFLMRADCFCPGLRGWQLLEVRPNQPPRVWDRTGRRVTSEWSTFSIDMLFDGLTRPNEQLSQVQIAFDERLHYPRYLRTSMIYPDGWSITLIRALRPI